jgi:nitrogen regulatory protein P-II 1
MEQALGMRGIRGVTITEVHELGQDGAESPNYRGTVLRNQLVPEHKLDLVVDDERVDEAIDAISQAAFTGEVGDGRILVSNLEATVHIRTGETTGAWHPVSA